MAGLIWQSTNPAYSPPSIHIPLDYGVSSSGCDNRISTTGPTSATPFGQGLLDPIRSTRRKTAGSLSFELCAAAIPPDFLERVSRRLERSPQRPILAPASQP